MEKAAVIDRDDGDVPGEQAEDRLLPSSKVTDNVGDVSVWGQRKIVVESPTTDCVVGPHRDNHNKNNIDEGDGRFVVPTKPDQVDVPPDGGVRSGTQPGDDVLAQTSVVHTCNTIVRSPPLSALKIMRRETGGDLHPALSVGAPTTTYSSNNGTNRFLLRSAHALLEKPRQSSWSTDDGSNCSGSERSGPLGGGMRRRFHWRHGQVCTQPSCYTSDTVPTDEDGSPLQSRRNLSADVELPSGATAYRQRALHGSENRSKYSAKRGHGSRSIDEFDVSALRDSTSLYRRQGGGEEDELDATRSGGMVFPVAPCGGSSSSSFSVAVAPTLRRQRSFDADCGGGGRVTDRGNDDLSRNKNEDRHFGEVSPFLPWRRRRDDGAGGHHARRRVVPYDVDVHSLADKADGTCQPAQGRRPVAAIQGRDTEYQPRELPVGCEYVYAPNCTHTELPKHRTGVRVTFTTVEIRPYERILGDNPSCSSGPSVGIGWKYDKDSVVTLPVDQYENVRAPRLDKYELVLSRWEREEMLHELGYARSDLAEAVRKNVKVKHQRRQTVHNLSVSRAEELMERVGRRFGRVLYRGRKESAMLCVFFAAVLHIIAK